MNIKNIFLSNIRLKLTDRFQKWEALNITNGTADLYNYDIYTIGRNFDAPFYLIRNMRNNLNGPPKILPSPLLGDDRVIDLPGGKVVVLTQFGMGKPFIMSEIQIGLGAVICYKDLTVLKRVHGSGVNVDIGVKLLEGY